STMLLATSDSLEAKKPKHCLRMRRSSSVSAFGFCHMAMSADMLISCGIQWLAQPPRYFSQAHLYLNGTSWLTSARQLMMRFSSTVTRLAPSSTCSRPVLPLASPSACVACGWADGRAEGCSLRAFGSGIPAVGFGLAVSRLSPRGVSSKSSISISLFLCNCIHAFVLRGLGLDVHFVAMPLHHVRATSCAPAWACKT